MNDGDIPELDIRENGTINGKPVFEIVVRSVVNFASAFAHKLLCDGLTFTLGSACAARCLYCYVEAVIRKHPAVRKLLRHLEKAGLQFQDVVIVRFDALNVLREQLTWRKPRTSDVQSPRIIYTSPLVDPALNAALADETAEACRVILELTGWHIRVLSKGNLLGRIAAGIPPAHRQRLIYGHSTGIIDNRLAQVIEPGTAHVTRRLLDHWQLQDDGNRTFGMICPVLPHDASEAYLASAVRQLRLERCEHVWVEPLNVRGASATKTINALRTHGFDSEARALAEVVGPGSRGAHEEYARQLFEASCAVIPPEKLRFLQYVNPQTCAWWNEQRGRGAVLLGKCAHGSN